jgi:hypothetical protein
MRPEAMWQCHALWDLPCQYALHLSGPWQAGCLDLGVPSPLDPCCVHCIPMGLITMESSHRHSW